MSGMYAEQLTVDDYKDLIDRGWRRSGKYCYKPVMDKTCCPQYTIRCDALKFSLSKSQKKIIKKFNKFLVDRNINKSSPQEQLNNEESFSELQGYSKQCTIDFKKSVTTTEASSSHANENTPSTSNHVQNSQPTTCKENINNTHSSEGSVMSNTPNEKTCDKKVIKEGQGADPNRPPCQKAKVLRLERKKEKLLKRGMDVDSINKPHPDKAKSLEQFLKEIPSAAKHKLKQKLISTSICGEDWEANKHIEFELYKKYQLIIHNDPPEKLSMKSFSRFLVTTPLKIVLARMSINHESFTLSAQLYANYQMHIHNESIEECGSTEFYNFLVNTPLKPKPFSNDAKSPGYGSFHQQYWIDDKLIAVGVIDILPECVSSVYFFYDPDYRELTLGTYGSLREVQLVQELQTEIPNLKYYYMGFYIHSCPKMRYKGKLSPSDLLCPETYRWFPISKCLPKLDIDKYCRLNEDIDEIDTNLCSSKDVDNIKVVCDHRLMSVKDYLRIYKAERGDIENLALLVGKKSAQSIIFWMV
ncbi:arginyl-tRNA--protein transferase 1 isoform X2 [Anthonomus grandis grandis]|uniref:arginyl-tRNA--protein transferase 1 isoform X2 n=1 Tax=Anthonomus grandis grandis TaxID=2921223 RepID=UPI0021664F71|nr:arginyl-tRNA--protein transferase 1 isoform X2 [Anthonomus grandis grandis]